MASRNGELETVRTLVELGVDKEAKNVVRNLMNNDDDGDVDDNDDGMKYV